MPGVFDQAKLKAYQDVFERIDTPIGGVPPQHIDDVWYFVEPILQRVVEPNDGYALAHVRQELLLSRWQLWVVGNFIAVFVTEVQVKPLHRLLFIRLLAGQGVDTWIDDVQQVLDAFAAAHDCDQIAFAGRKGWQKKMARYYENRYCVFTRKTPDYV